MNLKEQCVQHHSDSNLSSKFPSTFYENLNNKCLSSKEPISKILQGILLSNLGPNKDMKKDKVVQKQL